MNWETTVEVLREGSVIAGIMQENEENVSWGVSDNRKIVSIRDKELKGCERGPDALNKAKKACEDAFYAYLDTRAGSRGAA